MFNLSNTEILNNYLNQLCLNIHSCYKFDDTVNFHTDTHVTAIKEAEILSLMKFLNSDLETLEENIKDFTLNPFVKNVLIPECSLGSIHCKHVKIPSNTFIVTGNNPGTENDFIFYRKLGYFNKEITIPVLFENSKLWMSPTLLEQRSMEKALNNVHDHLLIFGLGMGYFPYMALLNGKVKTITIVEKNIDIINFFNEHIKKFFPSKEVINIIHDDIYNYLNKEGLANYDSVFIDTYENYSTGIDTFIKIMNLNLSHNNLHFWLEDNFYQIIRNQIILYLNSAKNKKFYQLLMSSTNTSAILLKKINKYFRENFEEISSPEEIKKILSNKDILIDICRF